MPNVKHTRHLSTDLLELQERLNKALEDGEEVPPTQGYVDIDKMNKKELKDFAKKGGLGACVAKLDMLAGEDEELMFLSGERIIVLKHIEDDTYLGYCEGVVGQFSAADVHFVELDPQVLADLDLPVDQADWLDERASNPDDELASGAVSSRSSSDSFPRHSSEDYDEFAESTGNSTSPNSAARSQNVRNSVASVRSSVYSNISTMSSGSGGGSQRAGSRGKGGAANGHQPHDSTDSNITSSSNNPPSIVLSEYKSKNRNSFSSPPAKGGAGTVLFPNRRGSLKNHDQPPPTRKSQPTRYSLPLDSPPRSVSPEPEPSSTSGKTRKLKPRKTSTLGAGGNASGSSGGERFDTSSLNNDYSDPSDPESATQSVAGSFVTSSSTHSNNKRWSTGGGGKSLPTAPKDEEQADGDGEKDEFAIRDENENEGEDEDEEGGVRWSMSKEPPRRMRNAKSANELVDEWGFVYDKDAKDLYIPPPEQKDVKAYLERESKWLSIVLRMDAGAVKKDSKLKKLVRSGIPASVRGRAWQFLAGSAGYRKTGVYEELIRRDRLPIFDVIERDIHRCYPEHVMFRDENSQGQADLNNVLKAYAHYNPSVGYCQGMGRLVGCMLMQMPAEDSFWLLVATIDKYMAGYFIPTLSQLRIDAYVFEQLLREHEPKLAQHMVDNDVVPLMYITQWFLTAFTLTLPWPTVLRVWDVFYFEGVKVFYRIGLAIIWLNRDHLLRHCPTNAELLEFLLHIPFDNLGPENLLETAFKIKLSKDDIKKYSRKASSEASTQGLPVEFGINNLSAGQLSNNSASALVGAMAGVGGKIKRTAVGGGSAHSGSLGKAGGKKISFM